MRLHPSQARHSGCTQWSWANWIQAENECVLFSSFWKVWIHKTSHDPSLCRFDELVKKFKVEYHAGGATQNSIKIAQVGARKHTSCFPRHRCWSELSPAVDDPRTPQRGHVFRLHRQRQVWRHPEEEGRGGPHRCPLLRAGWGAHGDVRRLHHRRQQVGN